MPETPTEAGGQRSQLTRRASALAHAVVAVIENAPEAYALGGRQLQVSRSNADWLFRLAELVKETAGEEGTGFQSDPVTERELTESLGRRLDELIGTDAVDYWPDMQSWAEQLLPIVREAVDHGLVREPEVGEG